MEVLRCRRWRSVGYATPGRRGQPCDSHVSYLRRLAPSFSNLIELRADFVLGQTIGGMYIAYGPKVKWFTIFASAAGAALTASLAAVDPAGQSAAIAQAILALMFIGIVEGLSFPAVTLMAEDQDIGLAAGVLGSIRGMAGAIAQALYVAILTNKSSQYIASYIPPAVTEAGLSADAVPAVFEGLTTGSFDAVPGINPSILGAIGAASQRAYADTFYWVFIATIPFGKTIYYQPMQHH